MDTFSLRIPKGIRDARAHGFALDGIEDYLNEAANIIWSFTGRSGRDREPTYQELVRLKELIDKLDVMWRDEEDKLFYKDRALEQEGLPEAQRDAILDEHDKWSSVGSDLSSLTANIWAVCCPPGDRSKGMDELIRDAEARA
jgi:hypothetical protein